MASRRVPPGLGWPVAVTGADAGFAVAGAATGTAVAGAVVGGGATVGFGAAGAGVATGGAVYVGCEGWVATTGSGLVVAVTGAAALHARPAGGVTRDALGSAGDQGRQFSGKPIHGVAPRIGHGDPQNGLEQFRFRGRRHQSGETRAGTNAFNE